MLVTSGNAIGDQDDARSVESSPSKCEDMTKDYKKQPMTITDCPHTGRKHYAKNMCPSCYRKFGRN